MPLIDLRETEPQTRRFSVVEFELLLGECPSDKWALVNEIYTVEENLTEEEAEALIDNLHADQFIDSPLFYEVREG